jgi:hypothetical protein
LCACVRRCRACAHVWTKRPWRGMCVRTRRNATRPRRGGKAGHGQARGAPVFWARGGDGETSHGSVGNRGGARRGQAAQRRANGGEVDVVHGRGTATECGCACTAEATSCDVRVNKAAAWSGCVLSRHGVPRPWRGSRAWARRVRGSARGWVWARADRWWPRMRGALCAVTSAWPKPRRGGAVMEARLGQRQGKARACAWALERTRTHATHAWRGRRGGDGQQRRDWQRAPANEAHKRDDAVARRCRGRSTQCSAAQLR